MPPTAYLEMEASDFLLPQTETNRYKNIYAVHVLIPKAYCQILEWGQTTEKDADQSYLDYVREQCSQRYLRDTFNNMDMKTLMNTTSAQDLDTNLLFKLIQISCKDLKPKKHQIWKETNDEALECCLSKLKSLRNSICHDIRTSAVSSDMFNDVVKTIQNLYKVASDEYSIGETPLQKALKSLENYISDINLTDEEKRRINNQYHFRSDGYAESREYWKVHCSTDVIPFSGDKIVRDKVYHPLEISVRTLSISSNPTHELEVVSYFKIIEPWFEEDDCAITIVQGEAGSGKSTVAKNIALQFFNFSNRTIDSLSRFDMIHFMECRNRNVSSLEQFLKKHYPKTCRKLGAQDTVDSFAFSNNLIFIDGFDELNTSSKLVMQDILDKLKSMSNCHLIITSRPHSMSELTHMLNQEGLDYRVCELMPIIHMPHQIEFLKRYCNARHDNDADISSAIEVAFTRLRPDVRENFFIYPINLVLYYHLFSSGNSHKLVNSSEITLHIFDQYRTVMKRKLEHEGLKNMESMISCILDEISLFSFECLAEDKISLSESDVANVSKRCTLIFKEYGALSTLDVNQILSVIFLCRSTPTPETETTYQFFHKSIQEMLAGKILMGEIKDENCKTVRSVFAKILKNEEFEKTLDNNTIKRYLNVFKFVVIELCEPENCSTLYRHIKEIISMVRHMQDRFQYCAQLVKACNYNQKVVKYGAKSAGNWWGDKDGSLLMATCKMIQYNQPEQIRIFLPFFVETPTDLGEFLNTLNKKYKGCLVLEMQKDHFTYTPSDNIVSHLRGAKLRIVRLRGCITQEESVRTIVNFATKPEPDFYFSLVNPFEHHLALMNGKPHYLTILVKYNEEWPLNPTRRPLPSGSQPVWLIVEGVPLGGIKKTRNLITSLAPVDYRFRELELQNCALSIEDLSILTENLSNEGIRTSNRIVRESWHEKKTNRNGICWGCGKTIHSNGGRCIWLTIGKGQS